MLVVAGIAHSSSQEEEPDSNASPHADSYARTDPSDGCTNPYANGESDAE